MKHIFILVIAHIALLFTISSCNSCSNDGSTSDTINIVAVDSLPRIVELEGTIGDGTSMNELEIIGKNGDTVVVSVPHELIKGDVKAGDIVNVVYYVNKDENLASIVINKSALMHLWSATVSGHKQSLELDAEEVAISYDMPVDYSHWELKDGLLLLEATRPLGSEKPQHVDTFEIMSLTESNLVLMRNHEEIIFDLEN